MYKIGVIGDRDSILGFQTLGIAAFPTSDPKVAAKTLHDMVKDNYAIVFVTEQIASEIEEYIDAYKSELLPAIILIPNNQGVLGIGMRHIKESAEKAIGADILFGNEEE